LPIKNVAQAKGFYDPQVEADLNTFVEGPANPFLERLRRTEGVDAEGRFRIAQYLATMIKRVPRNRERAKEILPKVLDAVVAGVRSKIMNAVAHGAIDQSRLPSLFAEVDRLDVQYRVTPPPDVRSAMRSPWPNRAAVEIVAQMYWRVVTTADPETFIISDNPAFFFEGYGLKNPDSELCFPLSPTHCLHCGHQPIAGGHLGFGPVGPELVREVNRRIVSGATKLVFAHRKLPWLTELLRDRSPDLNRIAWQE
jgi:hypothetical protein